MTKYQERVKDVEELTPRLYAQFSIAFNHLKERLSAGIIVIIIIIIFFLICINDPQKILVKQRSLYQSIIACMLRKSTKNQVGLLRQE
jgi:hypothetical protein